MPEPGWMAGHMAGGHRHPGAQSGSSSVAVALEGVEDGNSQCLPIPGRALEVASQMVHCYVSSTKHRIWSHGDTQPSSLHLSLHWRFTLALPSGFNSRHLPVMPNLYLQHSVLS